MNPLAMDFVPQVANKMDHPVTPKLSTVETSGLITPPNSVNSSPAITPKMHRPGQSSSSSVFGEPQIMSTPVSMISNGQVTPNKIVEFTPFHMEFPQPAIDAKSQARIPRAPAAMTGSRFHKIFTPKQSILETAQRNWSHYESDIRRQWPANIPKERLCPWVPRTFDQYIQHLTEMTEIRDKAAEQKELNMAENRKVSNIAPMVKSSHSLHRVNNRGAVFGCETIWCSNPYNADAQRYEAAWPSYEEFKWEGDSRIATEKRLFRRMFPLPRMSPSHPDWCAEYADYRICPRNHTNDFDDLHIVPTADNVCNQPAEIGFEDAELLLNKALRDAIIDSV
jgi:hypothetical protein